MSNSAEILKAMLENGDCREYLSPAIEGWLRLHEFDGLCHPETECGCTLDDFAPCGEGPYPECEAAYKHSDGFMWLEPENG